MKATKIIFKLFILSIVFVACSTEDPAELDGSLHELEQEETPVNAGTFTAMIDGVAYEVEITSAVVEEGFITVTGKRGDETINLRMPSNITPNDITNPYVLGGAETTYAAFYNTIMPDDVQVADVAEATTLGDLNMTFDENVWVADTPLATILGGVTTVKGVRSAQINTGNMVNGEPELITVTQELEMVLQTDQAGAHTFGALNVAHYSAGGAGGDVFETDMTMDNGNVTLDIDTDNKLISGTFNFDGRETYTSTYTAINGDDTDGDGMIEGLITVPGTEESLGYDPNDPCSPIRPVGYTGYDNTNAIWLAGDCNGNGISNADELLAGNDPYDGNVDTDGDGVSDLQEDADGTDSADPCDPSQLEEYNLYDATEPLWLAGDCDNDTVNNEDELTNGTDPYFMDFLDKSFTSGEFTNISYADGGATIDRGLNISTHDVANKNIVGTFSFIAASIGEEDVRWYIVTEGSFDVNYVDPNAED